MRSVAHRSGRCAYAWSAHTLYIASGARALSVQHVSLMGMLAADFNTSESSFPPMPRALADAVEPAIPAVRQGFVLGRQVRFENAAGDHTRQR